MPLGRKTSRPTASLRVGIVTLGCDKNTVDNEYLAGLLDGAGCEVVTTRRDGTARSIPRSSRPAASSATPAANRSTQSCNWPRPSACTAPRRLYVAGCSAALGAELMAEIRIDGLFGVGQ